MNNRIDKTQISFTTAAEQEAKDKKYWHNASVKEKFQTITYLRECFYGPEATTGRLQRFYSIIELE